MLLSIMYRLWSLDFPLLVFERDSAREDISSKLLNITIIY